MKMQEFLDAAQAILDGHDPAKMNRVDRTVFDFNGEHTAFIKYATGFDLATIRISFLMVDDDGEDNPVAVWGMKNDTDFTTLFFHAVGPKDVDLELQEILNWLARQVGEPEAE